MIIRLPNGNSIESSLIEDIVTKDGQLTIKTFNHQKGFGDYSKSEDQSFNSDLTQDDLDLILNDLDETSDQYVARSWSLLVKEIIGK